MLTAKIDTDVERTLKEHIQKVLNKSALRGWRIVFWVDKVLARLAHITSSAYLQSYSQKLNNLLLSCKQYINNKAIDAAARYFTRTQNKSKEIFDKNKETYSKYIEEKLEMFLLNQYKWLADLVNIGYPGQEIVENFDEIALRKLALDIYGYLSEQVRQNMMLCWLESKVILAAEAAALPASINQKPVRTLTEQCIQKYSWTVLEPFVATVIKKLLVQTFDKVAQDMLTNWIDLASRREVTRSLREIINILPDSVNTSLYSEEFMFGTTPIYQALIRASFRLRDKNYKNHSKYLLLISDGEFDPEAPLIMAKALRNSGITIICCYIFEKGIIQQLTNKPHKQWPLGAQMMFEMASIADKEHPITRIIDPPIIEVHGGVKMFFQINYPELLGEIVDFILNQHEFH